MEFSLKAFSMCVERTAVPAAKDSVSQMEKKVSRQKTELNEYQFLISKNQVLCDLETEQICQIVRASLTIYTYVLKNVRIRERLFYMIRDLAYLVSLGYGTRLI